MGSNTTNEQGSYFRQIDALRAVAVSMVIFSHWPGYHQNMWNDDLFWFNGEVGVKLFFIISGFLITGILLDEREKSEQLDLSKSSLLRTFYIRRFLRIFPLYYATLFVAFVLGHPDVQASWKWQITYLSNFYYAIRGEYLGDVSHFWSLAVEEQFYLIWPVIILFLPRKYLLHFIVMCICIAPLFRYIAMFIFAQNDVTVSVMPISVLDCLSAGALLTYLRSGYVSHTVRNLSIGLLKKISFISMMGFIVFNSLVALPDEYEWYGIFFSRLLMVPALLGIVMFLLHGAGGTIGKIFESSVMAYLGKISYGIYILHFFIPGAMYWFYSKIQWEPVTLVILVINLAVLLLLASLSWYCFEKPLNQLKRYFPYLNKGQVLKLKLESQPTST